MAATSRRAMAATSRRVGPAAWPRTDNTPRFLVPRQSAAGAAADPHRVDAVGHPDAGHHRGPEVRLKEVAHHGLVRAAAQQLARTLGILPGGDGTATQPGPV